MRKITFILILLSLISFGCEKNITLDIPKYENKVVVYCILEAGKYPEMSLSLSQSYYSYADTTGKPGYITNAQVIITDQNTSIMDTLHVDTANSFKLYFGKYLPIPGHHYIANINYQGKTITAQTAVPLPVKIDHIDYVKIYNGNGYNGSGVGSDSNYEFHIFFNDIPGEADNYTVTQSYNTDYTNFISDAGLDGKQLEIIEYFDNSTPPPVPFTVNFSVDNVTKETADFLPNAYSQSTSSSDPFSQPIIVEGNINGGLGLFGAMSPSPYVSVRVVK